MSVYLHECAKNSIFFCTTCRILVHLPDLAENCKLLYMIKPPSVDASHKSVCPTDWLDPPTKFNETMVLVCNGFSNVAINGEPSLQFATTCAFVLAFDLVKIYITIEHYILDMSRIISTMERFYTF